MTKSEILKRMQQVAREQLGDSELVLTEELSLSNDLDVDSIGLMTFVIGLEDEFGISIPDDKIDSFKRIQDVVEFIQQQ
ncbi:acyl carrier protein [Streptococcus caprae]|uniref:Acyl carrier protein n=1 Tax=Streptococcus caprae TaxID=1640501 RepID=A0ABV8CU79_9STRE